ncbi:hypothetical protein OIU76_008161 [Salix suchowensis]|nr:hypothetical protein OIU76_008161 [Salix suchowensis]
MTAPHPANDSSFDSPLPLDPYCCLLKKLLLLYIFGAFFSSKCQHIESERSFKKSGALVCGDQPTKFCPELKAFPIGTLFVAHTLLAIGSLTYFVVFVEPVM